MSAEKNILRQQIRLKRSQMPSELRNLKNQQIFENLIHHPAVRNADVLLAYASCGNEPDTWQLIRWALEQKIPLALPKCEQNRQMKFFLISRLEDLQAGTHDIPEPVTNQKAVITEKTVCLVPGLAFTRDGIRLGQGGGYYDRFLKNYPELYTIGIGYDFMLLDSLPCEAHDCQMNEIITDTTEVTHEV